MKLHEHKKRYRPRRKPLKSHVAQIAYPAGSKWIRLMARRAGLAGKYRKATYKEAAAWNSRREGGPGWPGDKRGAALRSRLLSMLGVKR